MCIYINYISFYICNYFKKYLITYVRICKLKDFKILFKILLYIYSSNANTVAVNLFILRFLMLPHLHREHGSWLLRVRALLDRSWKWRSRDFHAVLDAVNRDIYLENLITLTKISIFVTRYRFWYRMEKNRDLSAYRFIVPPLVLAVIPCEAATLVTSLAQRGTTAPHRR